MLAQKWLKYRYMLFGLCTGFHPFGAFGERRTIIVQDAIRKSVALSLVPLRVSVVIAVKELVPFISSNAERARETATACEQLLERAAAPVLLSEAQTCNVHKFSPVAVEQSSLLILHDAASGAFCKLRTDCAGCNVVMCVMHCDYIRFSRCQNCNFIH